jgi:hypothetical protein
VGEWAGAGVDEVILPDTPLGRGARRLELLDGFLASVGGFRA